MVLDFEYVTYRVAVCARCDKHVGVPKGDDPDIRDLPGGYYIEPLAIGHSTKTIKRAVNHDGLWFCSKECLIDYIQYNLGTSLARIPQPDEHISEM